jgi:hypothetical protein
VRSLARFTDNTRDGQLFSKSGLEYFFKFVLRHEYFHACIPEAITISIDEFRNIQVRISQHMYSLGRV